LKFYLKHIFSSIAVWLTCSLSAQDLSSLGTSDSLNLYQKLKSNTTVHGSLGTSFTAYNSWGGFSRRDPYNYSLSGNFSVRTLDLELPFSFYITNQNSDFRQPFNQFGLSPKYKGVTAHLGYRSISWSQFSLAGHTFLGAGVEANPGIFRLGFVYGRFRQAIELGDRDGLVPSYRRLGYAFKIGVGNEKGFIDFITLRGKDQTNSVSGLIDSSSVTPAENLVVAVVGRQKLNKTMSLNFEVARSAYTEDIRSNTTEINSGTGKVYSSLGDVFTPRASSSYNNAYLFSLNFTPKKIKTALKYRRVEGEFKTMGSYFFNNDLEDVTVNLGTSFFKSKVTFSGSFGVQRNNLNDTELTQTVRTIRSANLFWLASKKLNFGLNFSNYTSTLSAVRDVLTDSIDFFQVTNNYNLISNYNFGKDGVNQSLSMNLGYQLANARSEYNVSDVTTTFNNANLNYRYQQKSSTWGFNAGVNYTQINSVGNELINVGPTLGVKKSLLDKKVKLSLANTVLQQVVNGDSQTLVDIIKFGANYRPRKKHTFGLVGNYLIRIAQTNSVNDFAEIRGTVRYQYSF
jgi:hypothetical protein